MRELLGSDEIAVDVPNGARISDVATLLRDRYPAAANLFALTKFARNGRLAAPSEEVADGDEVALLPPVGGG
jgi:molybdopterin synthase catalytic subunit